MGHRGPPWGRGKRNSRSAPARVSHVDGGTNNDRSLVERGGSGRVMVGTRVRSLFGSSVWGSARTDFLEPFIDQAHAVGVTGSVARTQQTSFQFPILRKTRGAISSCQEGQEGEEPKKRHSYYYAPHTHAAH